MANGETYIKVSGTWRNTGETNAWDVYVKVNGAWTSFQAGPSVNGPVYVKVNGTWKSFVGTP